MCYRSASARGPFNAEAADPLVGETALLEVAYRASVQGRVAVAVTARGTAHQVALTWAQETLRVGSPSPAGRCSIFGRRARDS